jgi:maltooligosyltrehalose trehalohydrolase
VDFDEENRWLVLHRGSTAVVLNLGDALVTVPVRGTGAEVLLSTVDGVGLLDDGVQVPPHASLVLSLSAG